MVDINFVALLVSVWRSSNSNH